MENKKQQVVFIHGGEVFETYETYLEDLKAREFDPYQEKEQRWKDTLAEDLGPGFEVFAPRMPSKGNAKYTEWKIMLEKLLPYLNDGCIFIGHSLGGVFLAKYIAEEKISKEISALYLIAAPFSDKDSGHSLADFTLPESLENIEKQVEDVFIYHSKDDFVVPFSAGEHYDKALSTATLQPFDDRGHFLGEEFPELLKSVREMSRQH